MERIFTLKPVFWLALSLLLMLVCIPTAKASNASLQLEINGFSCTIDQVYTNSEPYYTVSPDECTKPPISTVIEQSGGAGPVFAAKQIDETPGKQSIFENSIMEPLAFAVGIGDTKTSSAQPIAMAALFAIAIFLLIDVTLYDMQFTHRVFKLVRRR